MGSRPASTRARVSSGSRTAGPSTATRPGAAAATSPPRHLGHGGGQVGPAHLQDLWGEAGLADRAGRADGGCGHGQDLGGQGDHLRRGPVAHGELHQPGRALGAEVAGDVVPVARRPGPGGLRNVADDGHGARERAAGQHAQLHRGEPLHLVHHDVAEGADFVVGTARDRDRSASATGARPWGQNPTSLAVASSTRWTRFRLTRPRSGVGRAGCAPRRSGRCLPPSTARRRATRCAGGRGAPPRRA